MTTEVRDKTWGIFGSSVAAAVLAMVVLARIAGKSSFDADDQTTLGTAALAMGGLWAIFALSYQIRPKMGKSTRCFAFSPRTQNTTAMCSAGTVAALSTLAIAGMAYCEKQQWTCSWGFKAFEGSMLLGAIVAILTALGSTLTLMSPDSLSGSSAIFDMRAPRWVDSQPLLK